MSIHLAKASFPFAVAFPGLAHVEAALAARWVSFFRTLWREMESIGNARAAGELQRQAVRYSFNPEMVRTFRGAAQRLEG
jgi:hypothetical protein